MSIEHITIFPSTFLKVLLTVTEHMKQGRFKKAWKAKTPAEIYQYLERNPAPWK